MRNRERELIWLIRLDYHVLLLLFCSDNNQSDFMVTTLVNEKFSCLLSSLHRVDLTEKTSKLGKEKSLQKIIKVETEFSFYVFVYCFNTVLKEQFRITKMFFL